MAIQKEFVLRYRSTGHVRFQVPERICRLDVAQRIEQEFAQIQDVTRVWVYCKEHKLSLRFDESVCPFVDMAKKLISVLESLEQEGIFKEKLVSSDNQKSSWRSKTAQKFKSLKTSRWLKGKYDDAKETVQAAKVITKLGMKKPKAFIQDPEQAIINFLNDVLILYLIKIHWRRITQEWILRPLKHRSEWLAVWYLFFLWMRSRKPRQLN